MYRQSNAGEESNNRNWISRFLRMKPEEKELYKDGDLISINPPNETFFRAPTKLENDMKNLNNDWNQTQQQWNDTDKIGQPQPVKTDHRNGEYFQSPNDTFEVEGWEKKKKRGTNKEYQPKIAPILKPNSFNAYLRANVLADGYGAVLSLYLEAAKYRQFSARMAVITKYINEKSRLEKSIFNERFRLRPPLPEVTLKHIEELQRYYRITVNRFEKKQIDITLRKLRGLLEESYAYYK